MLPSLSAGTFECGRPQIVFERGIVIVVVIVGDTSIMNIEVKFDGEEIIVTKPGTDFMLAYRKRPDSPTLKLTRSWVDPHTSPAGE